METEQTYNQFITQVVDKYTQLITKMSEQLPGFPDGGSSRPIDQALANGTMKQTLINSMNGITILINNTASLKSQVQKNVVRGALSRLGSQLTNWATVTNTIIRRIEKMEGAKGPANGLDILQYSMDAARNVRNALITVGDSIRDDDDRMWPIKRKL